MICREAGVGWRLSDEKNFMRFFSRVREKTLYRRDIWAKDYRAGKPPDRLTNERACVSLTLIYYCVSFTKGAYDKYVYW